MGSCVRGSLARVLVEKSEMNGGRGWAPPLGSFPPSRHSNLKGECGVPSLLWGSTPLPRYHHGTTRCYHGTTPPRLVLHGTKAVHSASLAPLAF